MQEFKFIKRKTGALQLGVWAVASLVVLLASGPVAHAATTTIDFETLPALAAQPSDFFTAGVSQTYASAGVFSIAGGVALGNPTFLGSFAVNGSTPNAYGTTDFADPSLLNTLTLNLPSSTQLVTNVTGKLFNGQPGVESYTITAFSGVTQVSIVTLSNVPGSSSATSFGTFSLTSSVAQPITKVLITTPNAVANGWDFFVDSIVVTFTPVVLLPDLTISKSHVGSFVQGSTGNNYSVVVSNGGTGDKAAASAVSVTDIPPSGLTVTAMSGTGWTCVTLPTCTRSDVLLAGNSYPAITVTVSVGAAATSPQVNSITVTTAATESNAGNNTATDSTVISAAPLPDLTISKSHVGSFAQGSTGNTYSVVVSNGGTGDKAAASAVSVTDIPPSGLTVTAMSGTGWTCVTLPTCTRSDVLLAGNSYPTITVTVSVGAAATSPQVNSITVTTAATESNAGNNTATDSTVISAAPLPDLTISKSHVGSFVQGQVGATYTILVTNSGTGPTTGAVVTVTDVLPAGLTATAMTGSGWTCNVGTVSCTSTAIVLAGNSFPSITLTVNVAANAAANVINGVSVAGGGETNTTNNTANDTTVITPAPPVQTDSFQVRYAANLTSGDSVINITNTGANGASLNGPGFGGAAGNICVNVYAFSPDEQLVSCCSCLLTPNGLVSLSVNSDLISNTLTGVRPNSVVVKLVNTAAGAGFTGTNCTNSAALAGGTSFPLAGGMLAFGTTIHGAPVAGTFGVAETPFLKATLSPAELASITNRCTNIVGNGSTFGICRSCRVGGLGSIQ